MPYRWIALSVLAVSLVVSGRHRRRARREGGTIGRRAEPLGLIMGRLLVGLPLFGGTVAYVLRPDWMAWSSIDVADWLRWAGVGLGAVVVVSVDRVLRHLGSNVSETVLTKPGHRLVTTGPYRRIRHPLYTTGIGLFLSIGLMASNAFILGWTAVTVLAIRFVVIPREEARLVEKFGVRYDDYRRRTGALLPRIPGTRGAA